MGLVNSVAMVALAVFSFVGVVGAGEPGAEPAVRIDTHRWKVELPPKSTLKVSNSWGDVRGRSSGDGKLLVVGIVQSFDPEQTDAEVLISSEEGEVVVRTVYPSAGVLGEDGRPNGRIDLSLLVPAGSAMEVETGNGLIEIKGIKRDLVARTTTGRLRVTTGRSLSAETRSGELRVALKNPTQANPARLQTKSGELRVDLLDAPGLAVRARSGGALRSAGESLAKAAVSREAGISEIRLGDEPWVLEALSESGLIEVRALPANELR